MGARGEAEDEKESDQDQERPPRRGQRIAVAWTGARAYVLKMDVPFNTHAVVKHLTSAGFTEPQAEALSDTVHRAVTGGVATKADLAELRTDLAELRVGLRWVAGIGAGIVAILVGAFGFGFNMLLGMTADIAAQGADIAALQTTLAAQGADLASIKDALAALAAR